MIALGIDPDLHDLAAAIWEGDGPVTAEVLHFPRDKKMSGEERVVRMCDALPEFLDRFDFHIAAVEGQALTGKRHSRPDDIVKLARVGGAAYLGALERAALDEAYFPDPKRWKGTVPKHAHQGRLYKSLGWGYTMCKGYARPTSPPKRFQHITKGQWKHVGDAILLARWATTEFLESF